MSNSNLNLTEFINNDANAEVESPEKLKTLREWVLNEKHLPTISDKMLETFLHSCYYDVTRTKQAIKSYYTMRPNLQEFFHNRNPCDENIRKTSDIFFSCLLPGVTDEGYKVIMLGHLTKNTAAYNYKDVIKLLFMQIDMWLLKNDLCAGYIFAIDCRNTVFAHISAVPFFTLTKICSYFQNALPIRLQGLILINVSPGVDRLIKCLRLLLTKRLTNMIYQFTEGNENLYKRIPKRMLPCEVGGDCKSFLDMHDETFQELDNLASWFQNEE